MPKHLSIPNATYFITQVTASRAPLFREAQNAELLLAQLRIVKTRQPFVMRAYAIMPDHLHLLIRPDPDTLIDTIIRSFKAGFTREYKKRRGITGILYVWQQDYRDHVIRDEIDLNNHLNYIHYNPVAHRYSTTPEAWQYTSFHEWKERGAYPEGWGWSIESVFGKGASDSAGLTFE